MSQSNPLLESDLILAQAIRDLCINTALIAYENAAVSGLCREGAWEAAISALRMMDLESVVKDNAPRVMGNSSEC